MAYETRPDTGSLFKNDEKQTEHHPDYKGSALVGGTDHWLSAWINVPKGGGPKYMSLKFTPKDAQTAARSAPAATADLSDDDIPF